MSRESGKKGNEHHESLLGGGVSSYGTSALTPAPVKLTEEEVKTKDLIHKYDWAPELKQDLLTKLKNPQKQSILNAFLSDAKSPVAEQADAVLEMLMDDWLEKKDVELFISRYATLSDIAKQTLWQLLSANNIALVGSYNEKLMRSRLENKLTVYRGHPYLVLGMNELFHNPTKMLNSAEIACLHDLFLKGVSKRTFANIMAELPARTFTPYHGQAITELLAENISAEMASWIIREDTNYIKLREEHTASDAHQALLFFIQNTKFDSFLTALAQKPLADDLVKAMVNNAHCSDKTRRLVLANQKVDDLVLIAIASQTASFELLNSLQNRSGISAQVKTAIENRETILMAAVKEILTTKITIYSAEKSTSLKKDSQKLFKSAGEEMQLLAQITVAENGLAIQKVIKETLQKEANREVPYAKFLTSCLESINSVALESYIKQVSPAATKSASK